MKKTLAGLLALTLTVSGVLCGCSNSKENEDISGDTVSSDGTDSAEDSDKTFSLSIFDNIYADYIRQQKLCTISNDFKILEVGTARDNPNGLAGAVKYDFNGDKVDDLVTFTFERNDTNGEDIRINLLEIEDSKAKVKDSCYLTDILDMDFLYDYQKGNTIYYSELAELQIVQSEYNGQLYFGVLLKEADYLGGLSLFNTKYSVFTVRDSKIETQAIGTVIDEAVFNLSYAKQIPESMSNVEVSDTACVINDKNTRSPESAEQEKARIDEMTVDSGKYNLFTNSHSFDGSYQIEGGAYDSKPQAFSAMLNGFGLDIDDAYNQSHYSFVSKNQSEIKTIVQTEQLQPFARSGDTEYLGVKLTLDSDIEELLENESPFKEPFADEIALYEDIMRYPYYYHDIWDVYTTEDYDTNYFVADITGDGLKELVIIGVYNTTIFEITIVKADKSVIQFQHYYGFKFHNNGFIEFPDPLMRNITQYFDVKTEEYWRIDSEDTEPTVYSENDSEIVLTGEEALQKIDEFNSGKILQPERNYCDFNNPQNLGEFIFIDDVSEIEYTWQKAYISQVNMLSENDDYEYSLIYVDNNNIPELYTSCKSHEDGKMYTYYDNEIKYVQDFGTSFENAFCGYIEKEGTFLTSATGVTGYSIDIYKLENGSATVTDTFSCDYGTKTFFVNDTESTMDYVENAIAEYTDRYSEITFFTYDEIIEKLNEDS